MTPLPKIIQDRPSILFTDVDDTLTHNGLLPAQTVNALYALNEAGIVVVPVTGGCAGWCDFMLRTWPIQTIIGESGSFWFTLKSNTILREFVLDQVTREHNTKELEHIAQGITSLFEPMKPAFDQQFRLTDIAFDAVSNSEHNKTLTPDIVNAALQWILDQGVQAKLSSIQINAWLGNYSKASTALKWLETQSIHPDECWFIGDSLNDESMFETFKHTFGVHNIHKVADQLTHQPKYITTQPGGHGFVELCKAMNVLD